MNNYPRLPDEIIETARQINEDGEAHQWRMGDYLADVVDELRDLYADAGHSSPREARAYILRTIANGAGLDVTTLRDREICARFFPPRVRAQYAPLTYHQLRACKSAGEEWQQYAEWALANLPAPPSVIRARIRKNGGEVFNWEGWLERLVHAAHHLIEEESTPEVIRRICARMLEELPDG